MKKVALITVIDNKFINNFDRFKWEKNEKEEFIRYLLSISPPEREEILIEMLEDSVNSNDFLVKL